MFDREDGGLGVQDVRRCGFMNVHSLKCSLFVKHLTD